MQDGSNARKAETAKTAQCECPNSTQQSIDRYDTNGEDSIRGRIVNTYLIAHTARMERIERFLCVAVVTWSVQAI